MKFLIFLLTFIISCIQETHFISTSIVGKLNEYCHNLPSEISERFSHLDKQLNELENKIADNHNLKKFDLLFKEKNRILRKNERIFIDCLGSERFDIILDHNRLEKEHIGLHKKMRDLQDKIISKRNKGYITNELEITNKLDEFLSSYSHNLLHEKHIRLRKEVNFKIDLLKRLNSLWREINKKSEQEVRALEDIYNSIEVI